MVSKLIGHSIGNPPYYYVNGDQIAIVFRTDADVVRSVLPPILELPDGPPRAIVRFVNPLQSTFGPYQGMYLSTIALLDGKLVQVGLSQIKTSFPGVLAGREVWGMSMQLGEVTREWNGDVLNLSGGRNGVEFARASVRLESRIDKPEPLPPLVFPAQRQLFDRDATQNVLVDVKGTPEGQEVVKHWEASSVLKLIGGQPGDDWSLFPVHEVLETRYASAGGYNILDRGRILAEW